MWDFFNDEFFRGKKYSMLEIITAKNSGNAQGRGWGHKQFAKKTSQTPHLEFYLLCIYGYAVRRGVTKFSKFLDILMKISRCNPR